MKPEYKDKAINNPDEVLEELLKLDWLNATEARQEYFMSRLPRTYIYGKGIFAREYKSKDFSPEVERIMKDLNSQGLDYNICFLNRYNNQKNQLGWHADDSPTMDKGHPIAVVSFGAERDIWWRLQTDKGEVPEENRQKLGHGSLFVMPAGFQELYFHRIPKCDRACGIRISLTFRKYI